MVALAQGEASSCSNPALVFIAQLEGKLVDLYSLEFAIYDKTTDAKRVAPVELEAQTAVDLDDCPTGSKIGTGRYVAPWTAPAVDGVCEIRWYYKFTSTDVERVARIEFEILKGTAALLGPAYAFVSDLRSEGVPSTVGDARIQMGIVLASRYIEAITGRFFEPRYQEPRFNGRASRSLLLGDPIIGVESIFLETEPSLDPDLQVETDHYRVFNRHLSHGLLNPDDRESPKIEFIHSLDLYSGSREYMVPLSGVTLRALGFPAGVQNVLVRGVFGYTEDVHNGSPWGDVPALIRHAAKLLTYRQIPQITDKDCREDLQDRWRVLEEKVRDQSIKRAPQLKFGQFTGDPEIDQILLMYTRPPAIGAA